MWEGFDGGRSSRAEPERGESCPGRMGTAPAVEWGGDNGDRRGKPPRWALERCDANKGREQGINVGREGFDSEQERTILVIVRKKHSSYLWATAIRGRIM